MNRFHQISTATVLILTLFGAHAAGAAALPREKDRWIEVDTAHFTLYSNATPATTRGVGKDLEQFRAVLSQITGGKVSAPVPTLVYVFSHDRAFKPYQPVRGGKTQPVSGLFQSGDHANYIAVNGALKNEATRTVYTIYAFEVLHNSVPGLPLWFRRGLAEYYSTLEIEAKHTNVGKPDVAHVRRLREHPTVDLAELFAARQAPDYRAGEPAYLFDARCWVVVHYLLTADEERRRQSFAFVEQLMAGVPRDAAFEKAFQGTYAGLQQEVTSYIRQLAFRYQRYDLPAVDEGAMEVRPMAYGEVLVRLGDLLVHQYPSRPEAAEYFRKALELDPRSAPAHAGLGLVEERGGRLPAAQQHYARAAALAPGDSLIQYRYASSLLSAGDGAGAAEAVAALRRSVESNPGFGPAWASLVYAYTFEESPPPDAVAAAETAHRLLPARKDVAGNLLLLYVRAGLREPAQALYDRFYVPQGTSAELAEARAQMAYLDLRAAYDLLDSGELEKARAIHESLRGVTLGGQNRLRIAEMIRRLGQDIDARRLGDRYNQAVERFNAGDYAAVPGLLEEVLAESHDARLTEQARSLLEEARAQLGRAGD